MECVIITYIFTEKMNIDLSKFIVPKIFRSIMGRDITISDLMSIYNQVMKGLTYLHSKKIVHGDLKLNNILIKKNGTKFIVKISDFGLSVKYSNPQIGLRDTFDARNNQLGLLYGLSGEYQQGYDLHTFVLHWINDAISKYYSPLSNEFCTQLIYLYEKSNMMNNDDIECQLYTVSGREYGRATDGYLTRINVNQYLTSNTYKNFVHRMHNLRE